MKAHKKLTSCFSPSTNFKQDMQHLNNDAVRHHTKTAIWSPDLDVFVIGIHVFRDIAIEKKMVKTVNKDIIWHILILRMIVDNLGHNCAALSYCF